MTDKEIQDNLYRVRGELPIGVKLVAVSKFHPMQALQAAYEVGQRLFGESRAQELGPKHDAMPRNVEWHFIGHLQTNKVRAIAPYVTMIHSIDSERLLRVVNDEALRAGRTIDVLLQLHVAQEATKTGFTVDECRALCASCDIIGMRGVRLRGVMGMASLTDDHKQVAFEFATIRHTFDWLRAVHYTYTGYFDTVSMGMSEDYRIAIDQGSTMVRIGSTIFGPRQY